MFCVAYLSVPLYKMICQKTGFAGTPQTAKYLSQKESKRKIRVQFIANTHRDLPWTLRPLQNEVTVNIGENFLAYYEAKNKGPKPIVGMATYNISPDKAASYFSKIQCFCFDEQLLHPGETMKMPVLFYVDTKLEEDVLLKDLTAITLSYTFFEYKK